MKVLNSLIISLLILTLIASRFFELGNLPRGVHIDEASMGAEAYSLLKTGRDTWGQSWPILFKAFGEYKAPAAIYSIIPFQWLGLEPTQATRMPAAIGGLISLLILFFTLRIFFPTMNRLMALFLVLLVSFMPWHYSLSRSFYEPMAGLPFVAGGLYYLITTLKNSKDRFRKVLISTILFAIGGYYYATFRYIGLGLLLWYHLYLYITRKVSFSISSLKLTVISTLVFLILISPILMQSGGGGLNRFFQESNKFSLGRELVINEHRQYCHLISPSIFLKAPCYLLWNKPVEYGYAVIESLYAQFGSTHLYLTSPLENLIAKDRGLLSFFWAPLVLGYIYYLLRSLKRLIQKMPTIYDHQMLFLTGSVIISSIPGLVIAQTSIHRQIISLYIISLILLIILTNIFIHLRKNSPRISIALFATFFVMLGLDTSRYLLNYFTTYTHAQDVFWQSDSADIYAYIRQEGRKYDRIHDRGFPGPIIGLFYGYLTPEEYQSDIDRDTPNQDGWSHAHRVANLQWGGAPAQDMLCLRHQSQRDSRILVIETPNLNLTPYASYSSYSFDGVHKLHDVYDIDSIYQQLVIDPNIHVLDRLCGDGK